MLRELSTTRYNEKTHLTVVPDIIGFLTFFILWNVKKTRIRPYSQIIWIPYHMTPYRMGIIWGVIFLEIQDFRN